MLYLIKFDVHQPVEMDHKEFFEIWYSEAVAALAAKEEGVIVNLWKVAGERTVLVLCELPDHYSVDHALESLPIMQKMGGSIATKPTVLYPYEQWAEEMRGFVGASATV